MRRVWRVLFVLVGMILAAVSVDAATLYVTSVACTNTYQVWTNSCGATTGISSYTSISAAYSASTTGDTLRFRAGTYANNGQSPKANQVWEGCRKDVCGTDELVTINRASGANIFTQSCSGPTGWTIRYFNIVGAASGGFTAIDIAGGSGLTLAYLDVSNWSSAGSPTADYAHGIFIGGYGGTDHTCPSINVTVDHVTAHDPACTTCITSGIAFGDTTGSTVSNSTVYNTHGDGIWFDTAGVPWSGTANLVKGNIVHDVPHYAFHVEARHSWRLEQNLAYNCGNGGDGYDAGIFIRVGVPLDNMPGHRYLNNTIMCVGPALQATNENGNETLTNMQVRNNVFVSTNSAHGVIKLASPYGNPTDNFFQNNQLWNVLDTEGVCWNVTDGGAGPSCTGGTVYNDDATGMTNWAAVASSRIGANITGDPLFVNTAVGDFYLTSGSPARNVGQNVGLPFAGALPDLGAFETDTAPVVSVTSNSPIAPGSNATLSWVVTGASECTASMAFGTDAGWTGTAFYTTGSFTSTPFTVTRRIYRLTCVNGTASTVVDTPVFGGYRLIPHPTNARYFRDINGDPMFLLGYNNEGQDTADLSSWNGGENYRRSYAWALNTFINPGASTAYGLVPIAGSDPNFDFNTWNQAWIDHLHDYLTQTYDLQINVGLTLFDGHCALLGGCHASDSIWLAARNVQDVVWNWGNLTELQMTNPSSATAGSAQQTAYYQRRFVDKLLAEVRRYPHVLIELNNEDSPAADSWWIFWGQYVKAVVPNMLVAVNYGDFTDGEFAAEPTWNMKGYHDGESTSIDQGRIDIGKILVADSDYQCVNVAAATAQTAIWTYLTKGAHWNDFVCYQWTGVTFPEPVKVGYYRVLLDALRARDPQLQLMIPSFSVGGGNCVTSGASSCLWQAGQQYIIYTSATSVTVNLAAAGANLPYTWINPTGGACTACTGTTTGAGSTQVFTKPTNNSDMALFIGALSIDTVAPGAPTNLRVVGP